MTGDRVKPGKAKIGATPAARVPLPGITPVVRFWLAERAGGSYSVSITSVGIKSSSSSGPLFRRMLCTRSRAVPT